MDINFNVVSDFKTGLISVGGTQVKMPDPKIKLTRGIQVRADAANLGIVYFGKSDVSATANGFALKAGETFLIPLDRFDLLVFIADTSAQKVWYFAH